MSKPQKMRSAFSLWRLEQGHFMELSESGWKGSGALSSKTTFIECLDSTDSKWSLGTRSDASMFPLCTNCSLLPVFGDHRTNSQSQRFHARPGCQIINSAKISQVFLAKSQSVSTSTES